MELRPEPAAIPAKAAPNPDADCSLTPNPPASAVLALIATTPATSTAIAANLGAAIAPCIAERYHGSRWMSSLLRSRAQKTGKQ
jgi:hypothetical protein